MIVEIKDGKKIITHSTGIVDEYSLDDVKNLRTGVVQEITRQNQTLIAYDLEISEVENSLGVQKNGKENV